VSGVASRDRAGQAPDITTQKPSAHPLLNWKALIGIAISAALLWWVFRDQDLGEIAREMRAADPLLLLLATVLATVVFWIRAWRWRCILDPVRPGTTFRSRFAAVNIGFMGNNLLPARVGEFARAYALARLEPVPIVAGLSSLVIERLMDALMLVAMLFGAMALPAFPAWPANAEADFPGVARAVGLGVGILGIVLFLLVLFPRQTVRFFEGAANRTLPRSFRRPVVDALEAFLAGVGILRSGRLLFEATLWTAFLWTVNAMSFWVAFHAFGIDLSFTAALFFQSCLAFAVSVPSAPGFWGVYELAAHAVLVTLWSQDATTTLAFAVGFHIAGFLPVTMMGLWYAWKLGLSLGGVARTEEVVEEAVEKATHQNDQP
jgi:uncharacterized protein (TIRG00374 family)